MMLGLAIYLYASRTLPPDVRSRVLAQGKAQPFGRDEWRAMGALVLLALPVTFFWATYEQQGNTIALWADGYTDRTINLLFWSGQIPVTWFQAFNPFMIFAFTPFILALWKRQAARGREPSTVAKMALGCFGVALVISRHGRRGAAAPTAARRAGSGSRPTSSSSPSASFIFRRSACRSSPRWRRPAPSR